MKKNAVGIFGIGLAVLVALFSIIIPRSSPIRVFVQVDGSLLVVIAGMIAAVRGSWYWLVLSALALGLVVYLALTVKGF